MNFLNFIQDIIGNLPWNLLNTVSGIDNLLKSLPILVAITKGNRWPLASTTSVDQKKWNLLLKEIRQYKSIGPDSKTEIHSSVINP